MLPMLAFPPQFQICLLTGTKGASRTLATIKSVVPGDDIARGNCLAGDYSCIAQPNYDIVKQ